MDPRCADVPRRDQQRASFVGRLADALDPFRSSFACNELGDGVRRRSRMNPTTEAVPALTRCLVCGAKNLRDVEVLTPALIEAWELAPAEVDYVNAQQGRHCPDCRSTLRCMALAKAILRFYGVSGHFAEFTADGAAQRLRVLEINEAGGVSAYLARLP